MFELKLDDVQTLFPDSKEQKQAQQSFPNDVKGDLLIKLKNSQFSLQKNVLGKHSAYFGQLATIKYLQMIEIQEAEIMPEIFTKMLKILYGFQETFNISQLENVFQTILFLRSKELKSCLIGQIKKFSRHMSIHDQMAIFQFAFSKQVMALSSYFMESFMKQNLLSNVETMKNSILILCEKALVTLFVHLNTYDPDETHVKIQYDRIKFFKLIRLKELFIKIK